MAAVVTNIAIREPGILCVTFGHSKMIATVTAAIAAA